MRRNCLYIEEIKSQKYGKLTVIKEVERKFKGEKSRRQYYRFFLCKCDCGNDIVVRLEYLRSRTKGTSSCGCLNHRKGKDSPLWIGYGKVSGSLIKNIKNSAKLRSLEFSIDAKFLDELFRKQNGKCALSGISLIMPDPDQKNEWTASVDRINSDLGYIKNNVQWVHKKINMMKQDLPEGEFVRFCKLIIEYQEMKYSF